MASSDENTKKLEDQIEKLSDKVSAKFDKITDELCSINSTLASQHEVLKDHTKRSTNLEDRMEPLETFHKGLRGVVTTLKILALIAGVLEACHIFKVL